MILRGHKPFSDNTHKCRWSSAAQDWTAVTQELLRPLALLHSRLVSTVRYDVCDPESGVCAGQGSQLFLTP